MEPKEKYWISTDKTIPERTKTILNDYLQSIKTNKAEATVKKYRSILERFFRECKIPLEELTTGHVQTWLKEFSPGKKERTVDLFLSALSSFFQFCMAEEHLEHKR